ncbi:MAG: hypothetical protein NTV54_16260 [Ignavibacteriales bacterium]|nr:hypothetical protein [Ignavibacteriales bacterium]
MKALIAILISSLLPTAAFTQSQLDAPELVQTVMSEQFSDVVKSVWDEIKKGVEAYSADQKSKSEFETTSAFEARMRRRQEQISHDIQQFLTSKKIAQRKFAVLMKADLLHYNADTQIYVVNSAVEILIPPKSEDLITTCPQNPYIFIREMSKNAYKFAYLTLNPKNPLQWSTSAQTAQKAKSLEADMFFKVWFRFDVSTAPGQSYTLKIIPEKIELVADRENTIFWKEDIAH